MTACVRTTPCVCGHPITCHNNRDDVAYIGEGDKRRVDPSFVAHDGCIHCSCAWSRRTLYAAWTKGPADAAMVDPNNIPTRPVPPKPLQGGAA